MIIYYVTCKNEKEAKKIIKELLDRKLISCGNIIPSKSIYEWKGKLKEESEIILIIKTLDRHQETVKNIIREFNSYDLPAILKIDARANEEYLSWMENIIK